jgi:hypothetical protein
MRGAEVGFEAAGAPAKLEKIQRQNGEKGLGWGRRGAAIATFSSFSAAKITSGSDGQRRALPRRTEDGVHVSTGVGSTSQGECFMSVTMPKTCTVYVQALESKGIVGFECTGAVPIPVSFALPCQN